MTDLYALFRGVVSQKRGFFAFTLLLLFYLLAFFAPWIAPYEISDQDLTRTYHPPTALLWREGELHVQRYHLVDRASAKYELMKGESTPIRWFEKMPSGRKFLGFTLERRLFSLSSDQRVYLLGSDSVGRDVFSRLIYGARVSLWIGVLGVTLSMIPGYWIGSFAGYWGGSLDHLLMRVCEMLMVIPGLYLLLALRSALGTRFPSDQMFLLIVCLMSLIGWSSYARIFRGLALSMRERAFVLAAKGLGQSSWKIIRIHFFPNMLSYAIVAGTMGIPGFILGEAALSFLGVGIQEPQASWGLMLSQAQDMKVFMLNFWWLLTPGLAIFIVVILFNILGDILRDLVDPQFRMTGKPTS
jgi:peptide/nickel transport system permease protein